MKLVYLIFFYICSFIIFWAMIGYPISLFIISKFHKNKKINVDCNFMPSVTLMIVAHNEEKVILEKLNNVINVNYPQDRIKYIVASDNSDDNTNCIVKSFIALHQNVDLKLYDVKERKGKINAQNEAQKLVDTEILVMTDANSMLKGDSINELVSYFNSEDVAYVCGRLVYNNGSETVTSHCESKYWDIDLYLRELESNIQTITAGNGALYACRNKLYYDFKPIFSHDSSMPLYYALMGKKALYNPRAIAYEKAGENVADEFSRKVRMNRIILYSIIPTLKIFNIIKYRWFSYFYFGHRTCRYLLWLAHLILLITNILLVINYWIFAIMLLCQLIFYLIGIFGMVLKLKNKYVKMINYYMVTVFAQWIGVYNILTGKAKPFWEKAESTR